MTATAGHITADIGSPVEGTINAEGQKAFAVPREAVQGEEVDDAGGEAVFEHDQPGERWNSPRINTYRFLAVNWSFIVLGMNDACIGVCVSLLPVPQRQWLTVR